MAVFQLAVIFAVAVFGVQTEVLKSNSGNVRTKRGIEFQTLFLNDGCHSPGDSSEFTEDQSTWITEYHNAARRFVSASNMNKLVWDDKLACQAQRVVDTCRWGHDNIREFAGGNQAIGQNIIAYSIDKYFSEIDQQLMNTILAYFYNEYTNYVYSNTNCNPGTVCNHYRMMMMSFQQKVGGACRFCEEWTNNQGFHNFTGTSDHVLFCVFDYKLPMSALSGNVLYKTGPVCSACDYEYYECEDGLCVDCRDNRDNNPNCLGGLCVDTASKATCDYVSYYKTAYNYDLCPQLGAHCQKTCGVC